MRLRRTRKIEDEKEKSDEWWRTKNRPRKFTSLGKIDGWSPILRFKQIFFLTLFIGVLFVTIGILQLSLSSNVQSHKIEYSEKCAEHRATCQIEFELEEDFKENVYFYYGLTNYYQNLRRMSDMFSYDQLAGDLEEFEYCEEYTHEKIKGIASEAKCIGIGGRWTFDDDDLRTIFFSSFKGRGIFGIKTYFHWIFKRACYTKPFAPCGALANAFFNDTFQLKDANGTDVPTTFDDLLFKYEFDQYRNPSVPANQTLCDVFDKDTIKPKNWPKRACELDLNNSDNNGFQNFDFIVWMRRAAHSTFKKIYRRLDRRADVKYKHGLPKGTYTLVVENNYNVAPFKSKKYFLIMTSTWLGGNWKFLGICYIFVGVCCLLAAVFLAAVHYFYGHTLQLIAKIPQHMN